MYQPISVVKSRVIFFVKSVSCFKLLVLIGKVMAAGKSAALENLAPWPSMMAKKRCACVLLMSVACSKLPVPTVTKRRFVLGCTTISGREVMGRPNSASLSGAG